VAGLFLIDLMVALGKPMSQVLDHLTEAQKRAYILADNQLALNAGWDTEMLAIEFGDLAGLGFDS